MKYSRCSVAALVLLLSAANAFGFEGRIVDAATEHPVGGAEVTILGLPGSVRTDADGRFTWKPDPTPPFEVLVLLPGGQLAQPVLVERPDWKTVITVKISVRNEHIVVIGVAPSIDTTPASATTMLGGGEIVQRSSANLMQALENVAGVNQVSEGQAAVPALRGLASGRTLILIDGGRVSSERRVGPSATFLDPESIEAVDVARGPGSVAYGSDAFGGVISIRTRQAEAGSALHFRAAGTVAAWAPEQRGLFEVSKGLARGGVLAQVHSRNAEDYRGPDGADVLNSGWEDAGFLVRFNHALGDGVFSAGMQSDFGRDIERPRNNSNVVRFYYPTEDSHRFTSSYQMRDVRGLSDLSITAFLGTYAQRTDQDRFATATTGRSIERADVSSKDFGVRATAQRFAGGARVEFGVDVNGRFGLEALESRIADDLSGARTTNTVTTSIENAHRFDSGAFVQAEVTRSRLRLAGGLRGDRVTTENRGGFFGDLSSAHSSASGFGSVSVDAAKGLSLTGQVSRGFRDPMLSDRYYRGPTGRGFITGNPLLEPETSMQLDAAVRHHARRLRSAVYVYQYRISDLIERYQTQTDFFFFRNRGQARLRGVEVELQANLSDTIAVQLSGARSRGLALDDDAKLDSVGTDTLSLTFRKQFAGAGYASLRAATFAEDDRPGPTEVRTPGYRIIDAGAGWRLHRSLDLRGVVRNLLDAKYMVSPDPRAVFAPGISASISAIVNY